MVGENLAIANTLQRGDELLKNSPKHFNNTIGKDWRKVGIGLTFNAEGQYVMTILYCGRNLLSEPLQNK